MKKSALVIVWAFMAAIAWAQEAQNPANSCAKPEQQMCDRKQEETSSSDDPNEMSGPAGMGEERLVKPGDWMDYTIYFENRAQATAAAQEIRVTLGKDEWLDWDTLELGEVAFGAHLDEGVLGKREGKSTFRAADSENEVRTTVSVSDDAVTWYMRSWTAKTADHFPEDFYAGILPPNDDAGRGEGHLSYRVKVREDVPEGAVVRASASIVFDANPAIETDPAWWNKVTRVKVQEITFPAIGPQVATNVVELWASASSDLPVEFSVTGPAELEPGNVLRFTGAGTVAVMARQDGEGDWQAAEPVVVSFEVRKAVAGVSLTGLEREYDGEAKAVGVETVPTGLNVAVTYDGTAEAPTTAGSHAVAAVVEDAIWEGQAEGTLVIAQGRQTIEFAEIGAQVATNVVALEAAASSGLAVGYSVEGPAVLEGNALRFTGAGDVTVTASQPGDDNWKAAENVAWSFEVRKAVAEVLLSGLLRTFNNGPQGAIVETVPGGLNVAVTYDGDAACPVNAGSHAVVATVVDNLWEGSSTGTLVIAKATQRIDFAEIGAQVATNTVALEAAADSGLAVTFAVAGPAVLEGNVLTFTGAGEVVVTASQLGDGNWEAAEDVVRSFEVAKAVAEVSLDSLEQTFNGERREVTVGTVPEGLEVAVTYDGMAEAPTNAGSYAVSAVVEDAVWAGSAAGTLVVSKANQRIDFAEIGAQVATNTVALEAAADSGLAVTFAVVGPAMLEGNVLTFTGAGEVVVTASQPGDGNWEAAEDVVRSFEVSKAVAEVSLDSLEQTFNGAAREVTVGTVPEGLDVAVTYDGMPEAPTNAGSYAVSAVVEDAVWAGSAAGTLVVSKATQRIDFAEIGAQVWTNHVQLGATASSGLPVDYAVVEGPGVVADGVLSFTGVGRVVVVASQAGDGNWEAAEEVSRVVEVSGMLSLRIESAHGTAEPGAGEHTVLLGETVAAGVEGSPAALGEGLRAVCTGWRLESPDGAPMADGEGMEARFEMTGDAVLTWLWETQALVRAEGLAHGSVEGSGWHALGTVAELEAVPESGHSFTGWTGDVPGGQQGSNPLELTVRGPMLAVATFYTTYYASEAGDDAADGLGRATAKRQIQAALQEAARGDAVVAEEGTYGAISVPPGVTVRSDAGAEKTTIRGGATTRCVEAAAEALVEGFTLEGARVDGDGAGALLADGAELKRCILRGNHAGGTGGGAKGGALENCLVVGNEAASGGGVAGAELRHCTVVRNAGGGAKDCRSVNCVFWENDGGDVTGGTTSWSLSLPAAEGTGNLSDNPNFAGDWRLSYESPCIDAGADSAVRVDLDGSPRPQPRVFGGELRPDLGCYEFVPKARFVWAQGRGVPPYESWTDAARDIQSALDVSGSGDRVVVEAGTYAPVTVSNAVILLGYRGAAQTVIDGGKSERAVTMTGGGTLEGFTIRNGASEDCGGIFADGGATVRNVVVEGCRATGTGGVGGGLCLYGGSMAENVTARDNTAACGGGVWATATSLVARCEIEGNTATAQGGGAWLEDGSRMEGCTVAGNVAPFGGGIFGGDCEVADSVLSGNTATDAGGGAAVFGTTFRNNLVQDNRAGTGGGLFARDTDGHDCLVTGNEAAQGAGVWSEGDGQLWNFTVADNAGTGAGVSLRGTALFGNGISWNNAGGDLDAESGTEILHSCATPVPEGVGNFSADPQFVGNGDYHLSAASPCLDAGEVQDWMDGAYDLDGQRRVEPEGAGRDSRVDVGADEAVVDAVGMPTKNAPGWTWRVVPGAHLQLQRTDNLSDNAPWESVGDAFTATDDTWTLPESFEGRGAWFFRLIWKK